AAPRRWQQLAALLPQRGKDPHGRRRPSVLAPRRGWNRHPVPQRHANRRNLQAAASVDTHASSCLAMFTSMAEVLIGLQ
ncbi:MAG: hypothetical protein ACRERE_20815, partial [Candidatus Entotheonellia bacterium]